MPSYAAGPRPATVRLAQTSSQCIKETLNRYLPLPSSATKPANSVAPKPQIIARNRVRPRRSHKPSRSNLHSAPQPPVSLTAVSFPGGFRTPAPVQAASSRWAVIRNPSQKATCRTPAFSLYDPPGNIAQGLVVGASLRQDGLTTRLDLAKLRCHRWKASQNADAMVPDDDALCARAGRAVLGRPIRGRRL